MSEEFMFVGGSRNGQYVVVDEPGLTQVIGEDQYILTEVDGKEVYSSVEMCYREVRAAARSLWKRQDVRPAVVEEPGLPWQLAGVDPQNFDAGDTSPGTGEESHGEEVQ